MRKGQRIPKKGVGKELLTEGPEKKKKGCRNSRLMRDKDGSTRTRVVWPPRHQHSVRELGLAASGRS